MNSWLRFGLIFISIIASSFSAFTQQSIFSATDVIKSIQRSEKGKIYYQTSAAICQFSGHQFQDDCKTMDEGIDRFTITDDELIVTGHKAILKIHQGEERIADTLPDLITCLLANQNKIYVGTAGEGVWIKDIHSGNLSQVRAVKSGFINDLKIIEGQLFVAEDEGLSMLSLNNLTQIKPLVKNQLVTHLVEGPNQRIIAFDFNDQVYAYNLDGELDNQWEVEVGEIISTSFSCNQTFIHAENGVYILTAEYKLKQIVSGEYTHILAAENLLLLAKEEQVYAKDITIEEFKSSSSAYSLNLTDGMLWIGSKGTILGFKNDTLQKMIELPKSEKTIIVSAIEVFRNQLIVGTLGDGVYIYEMDGTLKTHLFEKSEANEKNIIQLKIKDDLLWVANLTGLIKLNPGNFQIIDDHSEYFNKHYVYSVLPVSAEHYFVGTSGKGIYEIKQGVVDTLLPNFTIYSLAIINDKLYAGCEKGGLFEVYDLKTGSYPQKLIFDTDEIINLESIGNNIFVGSADQNYLVNPQTSQSYRLPNTDFSNQHLHATTANSDELFVGFDDGYLRLNKERLGYLIEGSSASIEVSLFNHRIDSTTQLFDYDDNSFTFRLASSIFYQPQNTYYRYRLLGMDTNWVVSNQPVANFYNLPSGDYTFEIAQGIGPSFQPIGPQSYSFRIKKAFWNTVWFWVIVILILLFVSVAIFRYRERQYILKEKNKQNQLQFELESLKSQIDPHFLFNSLNSMMELVEDSPKDAVKAISELSVLYRNVLEYQSENFISLEKELELATIYFNLHKIRFQDQLQLDIQLSSKQQENAKLIPLSCQILIENAIKHNVISKRNQLRISIQLLDDFLVIKNNITATKSTVPSTGVGLTNLSQRYALIANKNIVQEKTIEEFMVKLPLIYD